MMIPALRTTQGLLRARILRFLDFNPAYHHPRPAADDKRGTSLKTQRCEVIEWKVGLPNLLQSLHSVSKYSVI